jgi:hypothetical protein
MSGAYLNLPQPRVNAGDVEVSRFQPAGDPGPLAVVRLGPEVSIHVRDLATATALREAFAEAERILRPAPAQYPAAAA